MSGVADLTGQRVSTLRIDGMVARHPSPRYASTCEQCGARGTVSQRDILIGKAKCLASGCGRSQSEPRATLMQTGQIPTAERSRDAESLREFQRQQREPVIRWADQPSEAAMLNADTDSLRRHIEYMESHATER